MPPRPRDQPNLPPLPDSPPPFPTKPPFNAPLVSLVGWWLEIRCSRCPSHTDYPFRLMAARMGWQTPLRDVISRFRCQGCGARPWSLVIVDNVMERARAEGKPRTLKLL